MSKEVDLEEIRRLYEGAKRYRKYGFTLEEVEQMKCEQEAEEYGLQPYDMDVHMSVPDRKTEPANYNTMNNSIHGSNICGNDNVNINSNNIQTFKNNKFIRYNKETLVKVFCNIPSRGTEIGVDYRDILPVIYNATKTKYHTFTGFVNSFIYKKDSVTKKSAAICNIFWNHDVYVCNHIIVKSFLEDIEIGDFIEFDGIIYWYDRQNTSEDTGIEIMKINRIIKPDVNIDIHVEQPLNTGTDYIRILYDTPRDILYKFYKKQITRISLAVEDEQFFPSEMFISLLELVYYEDTKDYDMVKSELKMDKLGITPGFIKLTCFVRYLLYDCKIKSPFIVYTLLCYTASKKDSKEIVNRRFHSNILKFAMKNLNSLSINPDVLINNFFNSLCVYIDLELKPLLY